LLYPNAYKLAIQEREGWFEAQLNIDFQ
jgi:hypothetical protein